MFRSEPRAPDSGPRSRLRRRVSGAVRGAFTRGMSALVDALARMVPGRTRAARRRAALASFAAMAGAVMLARAVDDDDLAAEILEAVKASVTRTG